MNREIITLLSMNKIFLEALNDSEKKKLINVLAHQPRIDPNQYPEFPQLSHTRRLHELKTTSYSRFH